MYILYIPHVKQASTDDQFMMGETKFKSDLLQWNLRWSLCLAATSLKQPASQAPNTTKALQPTSVEQPPLYKGQFELAHRRLS